jgi:hypothetical protein
MPPRARGGVAVAPAAAAPGGLDELHRVHLKRTAELFSGDVGGRAELDEARRVSPLSPVRPAGVCSCSACAQPRGVPLRGCDAPAPEASPLSRVGSFEQL